MGYKFKDAVFGPGFSKLMYRSECIVARLINSNALNIDGSIDYRGPESLTILSRRNLWLYIYYLWQNNNVEPEQVPVLYNMNWKRVGKKQASADNFVKSVTVYLESKQHDIRPKDAKDVFSEFDLIAFINYLIEDYHEELQIPFLTSIIQRIMERAQLSSDYFEQERSEIKQRIAELEEEIEIRKQMNAEPITYAVDSKESGEMKIDPKGRNVLLKVA